MTLIYEADIEDWVISLLQEQGYSPLSTKLRSIVRRLLKEYGYPPDEWEMAMDKILEQAESFAGEWSAAT